MNHQNHTRTNGHVRYNLPPFGDLRKHNQSKDKFAKNEKIGPLRATPTASLFLLAKFGVWALCKNRKLYISMGYSNRLAKPDSQSQAHQT
jgi:hypothetical protein